MEKSTAGTDRPKDAQRTLGGPAPQAALATAHLALGLLTSIGAVAVFARIWDTVEDKRLDATPFDRVILHWMGQHHTPWATALATGLAFMGSPPVIVSIAVVAALVGVFWHRVRGAAWTLPVAVIGAGLIIQAMKLCFHRPRPTLFTPLLHETGFSFPSGHSLIAVVVYGLIGYFVLHLFRARAARRTVGTLTVLLVLSIGVSRVYVGVHYPTDVLAGWTAGLPWLLTCLWIHERLTRRFAAAGEPVLHLPTGLEAAARA